MSKTNQSIIFLLAFLCVTKLSLQCLPPLGWTPPTIEERARGAPLVVRASLVKKIPGSGILLKRESFGPHSSYTACLNVSHVYKGILPAGDICASGRFGDPVFCKTDLAFGVFYVVFLNTDPLSARYEFIAPAAVPYSKTVLAQVSRGVCCPKEFLGCARALVCPCTLTCSTPISCQCKGRFKFI